MLLPTLIPLNDEHIRPASPLQISSDMYVLSVDESFMMSGISEDNATETAIKFRMFLCKSNRDTFASTPRGLDAVSSRI
jgi:hypothetical protein